MEFKTVLNSVYVGAAAVGLGLSALGYKMYNKKRGDEAYETLFTHSGSDDSSHGHMAAADKDIHLRYGN
jgi:hypothetical protein|tara:strand:- start:34 stop:240 length:207 start_codon:yes stop_codon:yes gene_type:complete